jgi:rare lipoprotein A
MAMGKPAIFRQGFIISSIAVLMGVSGCGPTGMGGAGSGTPVATSVEVVERDVEAPDVFDVSEAGLWDGRPSLGGIWVAHPDVKDPERVIIRNKNNGKFVIGALFRRERENAGPRLQLSSDAADALGILAGQPTNVSVTALRRETVSAAPEADAVEKPTEVSEAPLDPVVETADAAIEATPVVAPEKPAASVTKAPASTSSLSKPYIQIGIFSVEQNAKNTAQSMRQRGIIPLIKEMTLNGKTFWRVIVGPAQSASDLKSLKDKVQKAGFSDAYAVSG